MKALGLLLLALALPAAGQNYRDDIERINARFDAQLARLQKLWRAPQ